MAREPSKATPKDPPKRPVQNAYGAAMQSTDASKPGFSYANASPEEQAKWRAGAKADAQQAKRKR